MLSSIHAFGQSTVGPPFLTLIGLLLALSIGLVIRRRAMLQPEARSRCSLASRCSCSATLALIVLVVVVICGARSSRDLRGAHGEAASVSTTWFSQYATPSALAIVALSGLAPMLPWGRGRWGAFGRSALVPGIAAVVVHRRRHRARGPGSVPALLMIFAGRLHDRCGGA